MLVKEPLTAISPKVPTRYLAHSRWNCHQYRAMRKAVTTDIYASPKFKYGRCRWHEAGGPGKSVSHACLTPDPAASEPSKAVRVSGSSTLMFCF